MNCASLHHHIGWIDVDEMARRAIVYDDINLQPAGNGTAIPSTSQSPLSSVHPLANSPTNGKVREHWTEEGRPITASAARAFRKALRLLESGKIDEAKVKLKGMGNAEKSTEIKEALAWAIEKRQNAQSETSAKPIQKLAKTNGAVTKQAAQQVEQEDEEEDDDDTDLVGTSISWQGTNQPKNSKKRSGKGKSLSHAEIWDDSALIGAWDAAMEEYKRFDEMRKSHQSKRDGKRARDEGEVEEVADTITPASKRSSLWHDSPDVGSEAAQQAKEAAEKVKETERELLERKKREAKELLAQIMPQEEDEENFADDAPPSKDMPGNEAYSNTPNNIADSTNQVSQTNDHAFSNGTTAANADSATINQTMSKEDILQNLAMSWYYAGYYQAMAVQMTQQQQ